jgi:hypothetical protein
MVRPKRSIAGAYGGAGGRVQGERGAALWFAGELSDARPMRLIAFLASLVLPLAAWAQPADPLHAAVDGYVLLQSDITDLIEHRVSDADELTPALALAARHNPQRVASGWIAYGALTAAQSPAFVAGVRSRVRAAGRAPVLRQLRRDLAYARNRPPGSAEAIHLILASTAADTARMIAAGHRYSGIGERFATSAPPADTARREQRNTEMRTLAGVARVVAPDLAPRAHPAVLSATPLTSAEAFGGRRFWDALGNRASPTPPAFTWHENSAHAARVNRMLTLAALLIVGATDNETARVNELLNDRRLTECLEIEQLQLRQCTSVAASANEDAHCIARHGLTQPAACFAAIVSAP